MRIDGLKTWISNGGIADHYVVFARTGEAPGARGLSAFVVEADAPGLSIAGRIVRKRQVVFNGYRVTALGIRFAEMPPRLRGAFFAFAEGSRDYRETP